MKKKILSILLSMCMAVTLMPQMAFAAGEVSAAPGLQVYAAKDQLMDAFSSENTDNIGRLIFGRNSKGEAQEWFILGKDNSVSGDNIMIFAAGPIAKALQFRAEVVNGIEYDPGWGCDYGGYVVKEVAANNYAASDLRKSLQEIAQNQSYFTSAEQNMMNATRVDTYDYYDTRWLRYYVTDKLYPLDTYPVGEATIYNIGGEKDFLSEEYIWNCYSYFWLRRPSSSYDSSVYVGYYPEKKLYIYPINSKQDARPAGNLNLDNVLFASAAETASTDTASYARIARDKAMILRLDGKDRNIGKVTYDAAAGTVRAVKGSASGSVALVVQGNDGTDDWYYSRKITGTQTVGISEIRSSLGLSGNIDLSSCRIWLETTGSDGMRYAVATDGCSTKEELLNAIGGGAETVSLASDITLSSVLDLSDRKITLDLNGHTLKGNIKIADSSAAPESILTLIDSNPAGGGVVNGDITLTRGSGSVSHLYANGGTVTGMVSLPSYAGGIFCTSSTPTVFRGYAGNYGEIHGGIYYGTVNESCIKEKTVKFMDGDSRYALEVVPSGNRAVEPAKPSKSGYMFVGWYNGETEYDFTSAVTEDITLTAKWVSANISTKEEFKEAVALGSTFIRLVNDITLDSSASNKFSLSDKQLTVDLNGHKLDGYILLADTSAAPVSKLTLSDSSTDKSGVLAGNIELTRGSYGTGSFLYANGGTVTARVSMNSYVAKIYCTSNTPSAFKNSVGSYGEIHGGIFYGSVKEDRIKGKTVTFMNGSSRYALEVVDEGKAAAAPVSPDVKAGYTEFDGWYNGETKYTFGSAVNENLTLTAKYGNPIEYEIKYNLDGGTADNEEKYTVESDEITLNNPVKEGHVFTGWSETGVEGTSMTVTIPKGSTGNREYTANYEAIRDYTVTFDSSGGTYISPKTGLTAESKVLEKVTDPTKQGYTFAGWKCGDKTATADTKYKDLVSDESVMSVQLTAQWEAKEYTVSFDDDNISDKTGVKWTDKVLDGIDAPEKTGYTFEGWKCGDKTVTADTAYKELVSGDSVMSVQLTAQWEIIPAPVGRMRISDTVWNNYRGEITSYNYYNEPQTVGISAQEGSGSVTIEYLLSDRVLALDELDRADFNPYPDGGPVLEDDHLYIVYARLTNEYGYVSYISSDGNIIDTVRPVISGIDNGKTYCVSHKVTVTDKYLDEVTVNGTEVQLDENNGFALSSGNNKIIAIDRAGNSTEINVQVINDHKDDDKDHVCDYCSETVSAHADDDKDNICDYCGIDLTEEYRGGGYVSADTPVIGNSDDSTTSADLSNTTSTSDGTTTAAIDKETADKIVDKALENNSETIIIDATAKNETAADSTKTSQLEIPASALETIAEKTEADVTIKTDVGEVIIDNTAAGE
ncbi:MAG: InlB B-repeat-containing protein, partial [Clostridiales bacterium]|nr:InlB B-repeat-containing protein [Clostridiales bacterium]